MAGPWHIAQTAQIVEHMLFGWLYHLQGSNNSLLHLRLVMQHQRQDQNVDHLPIPTGTRNSRSINMNTDDIKVAWKFKLTKTGIHYG